MEVVITRCIGFTLRAAVAERPDMQASNLSRLHDLVVFILHAIHNYVAFKPRNTALAIKVRIKQDSP